MGCYSAGVEGTNGHPHPATLTRLQRQGATIYRTDQQGTLTAYIQTGGYRIETTR